MDRMQRITAIKPETIGTNNECQTTITTSQPEALAMIAMLTREGYAILGVESCN